MRLLSILMVLFCLNAFATLPQPGPDKIVEEEYRLPASIDPEILANIETEVWAKVYRPENLNLRKKLPLLLFLHGNHSTCGTGTNPRSDHDCTYTSTGTCPAGYVVAPNHEGYSYAGRHLASWGYFVVSINANRGITCGWGNTQDWSMNLSRGRLILKHLALLKEWTNGGAAPTSLKINSNDWTDLLDFTEVGLMGHSRGGEGARAALNQYTDPGSIWTAKIPDLKIKAIYEIGAVDGQTPRTLDADGVAWNQLLPLCDGDVSSLEGQRPFDRMRQKNTDPAHKQKSLQYVWGANHNFFNSEWQESDSYGCHNHEEVFTTHNDPVQQNIALVSMDSFFRASVGKNADSKFFELFDVSAPLSSQLSSYAPVDRAHTYSIDSMLQYIIDDFSTAQLTHTGAVRSTNTSLTIESSSLPKAAKIEWPTTGGFFSVDLKPGALATDVSQFSELEFRVARLSAKSSSFKTDEALDFDVTWTDDSGSTDYINIKNYVQLFGPLHSYARIAPTIRIPLSEFKKIDLKKVRSIGFNFHPQTSGAIALSDLRLINTPTSLSPITVTSNPMPNLNALRIASNTPTPPKQEIHIVEVQKVNHAPGLNNEGYIITLAGEQKFPVLNALPVLRLKNTEIKISGLSHDLNELSFSLSASEFEEYNKHKIVDLKYGSTDWQISKPQ